MEQQPDLHATEWREEQPLAADFDAADFDAGIGAEALRERVQRVEAQPLDARAAGFAQLHDELLAELQRSDHEGA